MVTYTVLQLNQYVKNLISTDYLLGDVEVKGEVSNCKYHVSGHIYFTLKDEGAQLQCVMFKGYRDGGLDFKMGDGDSVVVRGSVNVYEKSGVYQLYAKSIKKQGSGTLYEKFLRLKERLEEMGMFDSMYKKPIPPFSKVIGVVTAPGGAVIHDIENVSRRRFPGVRIVLCPVLVQGETAAASIVSGIQKLDKYGVDVIIVGRGGGSIEDLWPFNEEVVARAIFECVTPVISAVGHETDFTIADFVADLRAPTPSAAAELAVANVMELIDRIDRYSNIMDSLMDSKINAVRLKKSSYEKIIRALDPANVLKQGSDRLKMLKTQMDTALERKKTDEKYRLEMLKNNMEMSFDRKLSENRYHLEMLINSLESSSPQKKLDGGFSFTVDKSGKPLKSVSQVKDGDVINVYVADGEVESKVVRKETINYE